jgi:hypothetical protein
MATLPMSSCFPPTKRKAFFFEKKNQKTFVCWVPRKPKR